MLVREVGSQTSRELLADVQRAAAAIDEAHRRLNEAVARARAAGITYAALGQALGVSRQAAWERFSRITDEHPAESTELPIKPARNWTSQ